jgi:hypothetical protein
MNTYRHSNGNGSVVGESAHVSADSFLDRDSTVEGESVLCSSVVKGSALKDSFAAQSSLERCAVEDSRLSNVKLYRSIVCGSHLSDVDASGCALIGVVAEGLHGATPYIGGVILEDVTVSGETRVIGDWSLRGPYRIHRGEWERAPRHILISGPNGVSVGVSECVEGMAHVACRCRPVSHWLSKGTRLARRLGWTDDQTATAMAFLGGLG